MIKMVGIRKKITVFILVIFLGKFGYIFISGILSIVEQINMPAKAFMEIHAMLNNFNITPKPVHPFLVEKGM